VEITKQLEEVLYGYNYEVSLIDLITEWDEKESLNDTLTRVLLLGKIKTSQLQPYSKEALISEVVTKLSYSGDTGHGPYFDDKRQELFEKLISAYKADLHNWIDQVDLILSFWINETHPDFVFWGYAFFIENLKRKSCRILIGTSSD
jgi:hypothetical protein